MLGLERRTNADLRENVASLSQELSATLARREALETSLSTLTAERADLAGRLATSEAALADSRAAQTEAEAKVEADRETIEAQRSELARLERDLLALTALREQLMAELEDAQQDIIARDLALDAREGEVQASRDEVLLLRAEQARLNQQIQAFREQLSQLNALLETYEERNRAAEAQIVNLGERLNAALATKVQELARYRSEFFGRLREVLGDRSGIQIVGDRFVFQSEVLFAAGSDALGEEGRTQMAQLADTLVALADEIPPDIDWILRVDGHTDRVPISTARFPSNWELSTARAISVVKFLIDAGIPAERLAATGFGEYQPLDPANTIDAFGRNRRIELKFDQR
jgi:chemotaxis protein MotB